MSDEIPDDCRLPEYHFKHVCKLHKKGMMREIRELSDEAIFYCEKCNAEARKERNLCQPIKI